MLTGNRKQQPAKLCPPTSANHCIDKNHLAPSLVRQTMSHGSKAVATGIKSTAVNNRLDNTKASLDISVCTPTVSSAIDGSNTIKPQPQNGVEMEGDSGIAKVRSPYWALILS